MGEVLPFPRRTLAHVLLEIEAANKVVRSHNHQAALADREGNPSLADYHGDLSAEADEALSALRNEAITMIRQMTGVTWSDLEGALS